MKKKFLITIYIIISVLLISCGEDVNVTTAMPSSNPIGVASSNLQNDTGTYGRSASSMNIYHNDSTSAGTDTSELNVVVIA